MKKCICALFRGSLSVLISVEKKLLIFFYYVTVDIFQESRDMKRTLQSLPDHPQLDNMMCLVTFDKRFEREYQTLLVNNVPNMPNTRIHLIQRHDDIAALPKCKVFVLFVEFSTR